MKSFTAILFLVFFALPASAFLPSYGAARSLETRVYAEGASKINTKIELESAKVCYIYIDRYMFERELRIGYFLTYLFCEPFLRIRSVTENHINWYFPSYIILPISLYNKFSS